MNWRVSSLDGYQLVSNSDAHSPQALAREATVLADRPGLLRGPGGAGHRRSACRAHWSSSPRRGSTTPTGTAPAGCAGSRPGPGRPPGRAPSAASRSRSACCTGSRSWPTARPGYRPPARPPAQHLLQLHQVLGEIHGVGAKAKTVTTRLDGLVAALGSELDILLRADLADVARMGGELLGEAVARLRRGRGAPLARLRRRVRRDPALRRRRARRARRDALFDLPAAPRPARPREPTPPQAAHPARSRREAGRRRRCTRPTSPHRPWEPVLAGMEEVGTGLLDRLDALQRVARQRAGRTAAGGGRPGHRQDPHADPPDRLPLRRSEGTARSSAWPSPSPVGPPRRCGPGWRCCSGRPPRT